MGSRIAETRPIQNPVQPTRYGPAFRYGEVQPYQPSSPVMPQQPQVSYTTSSGGKRSVSPPPPRPAFQQVSPPPNPEMYKRKMNIAAASARPFQF